MVGLACSCCSLVEVLVYTLKICWEEAKIDQPVIFLGNWITKLKHLKPRTLLIKATEHVEHAPLSRGMCIIQTVTWGEPQHSQHQTSSTLLRVPCDTMETLHGVLTMFLSMPIVLIATYFPFYEALAQWLSHALGRGHTGSKRASKRKKL